MNRELVRGPCGHNRRPFELRGHRAHRTRCPICAQLVFQCQRKVRMVRGQAHRSCVYQRAAARAQRRAA